MRRARRFGSALCLAAAVAASGTVATPSVSVAGTLPPQTVLTAPSAKFSGYATPVIALEKGGRLTYTNLDLERHDVVQDVATDGFSGKRTQKWCRLFPRGKCPVFWSKLVGLGVTTKVLGLKAIKPGTVYTFYCTLHPGMKGKLIALPRG